ncbi:hypothetical protein DFP72DRAFT_854023 [Ephemerocybe angulata]|uniref:Uncharacterized protein n=1 Tax=Ephemerocybe angulata TaxID=980116 RepID=A0A8H6HIV1_9AGAR|nr:hypothetical protein DFP72DRAFT_854023 [Tulosesus angulatus]
MPPQNDTTNAQTPIALCRSNRKVTLTSLVRSDTGKLETKATEVDPNEWKREVNFHGIAQSITIEDERLKDSSLTILTNPIKEILAFFQYINGPDLRALCRFHGAEALARSSSKDLARTLLAHECTHLCHTTLLVFKTRAKVRALKPWETLTRTCNWSLDETARANPPPSVASSECSLSSFASRYQVQTNNDHPMNPPGLGCLLPDMAKERPPRPFPQPSDATPVLAAPESGARLRKKQIHHGQRTGPGNDGLQSYRAKSTT